MFAIWGIASSTILNPQSPFLNSTRTHKNCTRIRKRKYPFDSSTRKTPLKPFTICFAAFQYDGPDSVKRNLTKIPSFAEGKGCPVKGLGVREVTEKNAVFSSIAKPVLYACLSLVLAILLPIRGGLLPPAVARTAVVSEVSVSSKKSSRKEQELSKYDHEYSRCAKRLLEVVSGLLRTIEEVKNGKNDIGSVQAALKAVKMKKKELQDEIMEGMQAELRPLRAEKGVLLKRSVDILDGISKAQREVESLQEEKGGAGRGEGVKDKNVKLEEYLRICEREYNEVWERIGEIDDQVLRKETMALSIGVRELSFIERESEQLFEEFSREIRRSNVQR